MSDLSREVLSRVKPNNNERQEVSRTHSSDEVSVMEMERRAEQFKSQMDSQKYASISDEEDSSEDVTERKLHRR